MTGVVSFVMQEAEGWEPGKPAAGMTNETTPVMLAGLFVQEVLHGGKGIAGATIGDFDAATFEVLLDIGIDDARDQDIGP